MGGKWNTQLGPSDALFPAKAVILKWMILCHYTSNTELLMQFFGRHEPENKKNRNDHFMYEIKILILVFQLALVFSLQKNSKHAWSIQSTIHENIKSPICYLFHQVLLDLWNDA